MKTNNIIYNLSLIALLFNIIQCIASETSTMSDPKKKEPTQEKILQKSLKEAFGTLQIMNEEEEEEKRPESQLNHPNLDIMAGENKQPVIPEECKNPTKKIINSMVDNQNQIFTDQTKCEPCENTGNSPIDLLDEPLIGEIISHLSNQDIARFSLTSHRISNSAQQVLKENHKKNYITINMHKETELSYYLRIYKGHSLNKLIWLGRLGDLEGYYFMGVTIKLPINSLRFLITEAIETDERDGGEYIDFSKEDLESLKEQKINHLYMNKLYQPIRFEFTGYVHVKKSFDDKPQWERTFFVKDK